MKLLQNKKTQQQVAAIIEYAFNKKTSLLQDQKFLSRYQHSTCYGSLQADQLVSLVMANHFHSQLYGATVKMAGIGNVASLPEFRGQGDISQLMSELFLDLKEKQIPLAELAPFSENFYRKFGFENTSWQKIYQIPQAAFQGFTSEKSGSIKRASWEQLKPEILALYHRQLTEKEVGTMVRADWWWERLNIYYPCRFYAVCYDEAETAQGYLIYRLEGADFLVDELVYANHFALKKLLSYLKAHTSAVQQFIYKAPLHEVVEYCFTEQELIKITKKPYMMRRIVDIQTILASLPFTTEFSIEITEDEYCPWNIGTWLKTEKDVKKIEAEPDLRGKIQSFNQLLVGEATLAQSLLLDQIKGNEDLVLPQGQQSFYDYF